MPVRPSSAIGCVFCAVLGFTIIVLLPLLLEYTHNYEIALGGSKRVLTSQRTWLPRHQGSHVDPSVTVYIENIAELDDYYGRQYSDYWEKIKPPQCPLLKGGVCRFQHSNPKVDVVFRQAQTYNQQSTLPPYRYCDNQIVSVLNSETEAEYLLDSLEKADIRIDYHLASEIITTDACGIPWKEDLYKTPNVTGRKGVALLMSNCEAIWRNDYIQEVMKYIHVYSYGDCFHNVDESSSREGHGTSFPRIGSKHRMIITFENAITPDYISEKIGFCFGAGVIPVYWGPPEIYQWVPGEHSFIDPQKFKGARELAEYLKRVDEDDDLFRYHTTNFNYTLAKQTHAKGCETVSAMPCKVCEIAHDIKVKRIKNGISTNCISVAD